MTETHGPWDGVAWAEADWSLGFGAAFRPGVLAADPTTSGLSVFADSSGMQVKVNAGQALVIGQFYQNSAVLIKAIGNNASANPRIDYVVLRRDATANTIVATVIAGTPASTPVAPSLTAQDLPLAQVTVLAGAGVGGVTSIDAAKVKDARWFFSSGLTPTPLNQRPVSPYVGQSIYDGTVPMYWTGSVWQGLLPGYDLGWQTLTAASQWQVNTNTNFPPFAVRIIGSIVHMRGYLLATQDSPQLGTLTTIPAGYRPAKNEFVLAGNDANQTANLLIAPNGNVSVNTLTGGPLLNTKGFSMSATWFVG